MRSQNKLPALRAQAKNPTPFRRKLERFARVLRTGLLGRFVLVLGAVSLIPLIIIPWLVRLTRDSVTDQILRTHSVTARTTALRVDAWVRSLRISAQTLSSNPFLLQAGRGQVAEMVAGLLQADPAIKGAVVMDREAIGKIFLSRYLVLEILGTGGMGSVFRGWDPKLERPVAIKTVHMGGDRRASVDATEQRQVLRREAITVAKFNHPDIVAIYDVAVPPMLGGETMAINTERETAAIPGSGSLG